MYVAQYNEARLLVEPPPQDFLDEVARVNAIGDSAPGFIWRYEVSDGNSLGERVGEGLVINLTVWRDIPSLRAFTYAGAHKDMLRRRRDWFSRVEQPSNVLWYVWEMPTVRQARARLRFLRRYGPTYQAFTFQSVIS